MSTFEFNLKVIGFAVWPLDQPENSYPSPGIAVIVTSVPADNASSKPVHPFVCVPLYIIFTHPKRPKEYPLWWPAGGGE